MENRAIRPTSERHRLIHVTRRPERLPSVVECVRLSRLQPEQGQARLQKLFWGLDYHFEDAGEFSLDGVTWLRREQGTVHIYAPQTRYWERCSTQDVPFLETWIIFRAEGVPELSGLVANQNGFARYRDSNRAVHTLFTEILDATDNRGSFWRAQGTLFHILDHLVSAQRRGNGDLVPADFGQPAATLAERVDAYIFKHYHVHLTLDEIADAVGVSRSTITHRYRRETGTTPMARLNERRLDVARSMVLRGEQLKVVAAHTGFYDEYHLSNAFRRRFGVSPVHYRQEAALGTTGHQTPLETRREAQVLRAAPGLPGCTHEPP